MFTNELLLFLYLIMIGCNDSTVAQIIPFIMISIIMAIMVIDEDHYHSSSAACALCIQNFTYIVVLGQAWNSVIPFFTDEETGSEESNFLLSHD